MRKWKKSENSNHNHRNHFNLRISARYAVYFFFCSSSVFSFMLVIIFDVYRVLFRFLLLLPLTTASCSSCSFRCIHLAVYILLYFNDIKTIVFLLVLALLKRFLLQTSSLCKSCEFSSSSNNITKITVHTHTIVYVCVCVHTNKHAHLSIQQFI